MAQASRATPPVGARTITFGRSRCVKCNERFIAEYLEVAQGSLLLAGGVQQNMKRLRVFCFICNWSYTPEEARAWLEEHKPQQVEPDAG